jgi:hypothetical protein
MNSNIERRLILNFSINLSTPINWFLKALDLHKFTLKEHKETEYLKDFENSVLNLMNIKMFKIISPFGIFFNCLVIPFNANFRTKIFNKWTANADIVHYLERYIKPRTC